VKVLAKGRRPPEIGSLSREARHERNGQHTEAPNQQNKRKSKMSTTPKSSRRAGGRGLVGHGFNHGGAKRTEVRKRRIASRAADQTNLCRAYGASSFGVTPTRRFRTGLPSAAAMAAESLGSDTTFAPSGIKTLVFHPCCPIMVLGVSNTDNKQSPAHCLWLNAKC
jgi:hypothetical protein